MSELKSAWDETRPMTVSYGGDGPRMFAVTRGRATELVLCVRGTRIPLAAGRCIAPVPPADRVP